MRKKFELTLLLIAIVGMGNICFAQKQEINAFKEMNAKLLKSVKKQYKKDPFVELKDNVFYIVVEGKVNKKKMYMVLNEDGELLTPEPVASYAPFADDKNYVSFTQNFGDSQHIGMVDYRTGQIVLQPKYSQISLCHSHDAGYGDNGEWRPAITDTWVAYDPVANETVFFSIDGKNLKNRVTGPYTRKNMDFVAIGKGYKTGLYTMDGVEVLPQKYLTFSLTKDGFVITTATNPSLSEGRWYYGGTTINPNATQYEFNNELYGLKMVDGVPHYKVHRDDEWISYASKPVYSVDYVDEGQKYFDNGEFDKVIAYYEGAGIDAPHGGYYMGMASKAIGDTELAKLDKVISTLKDPKTYYYPVASPEKYTFNSSLLGSQFILAQDYFDRYLRNNSDTDPNDSRILKAKKYRGEAAVARNSVARKIEDYTTAYSAAAQKYATEKTNAEIEKARQAAAANSIATGLSNLLKGL